MRVIVHGGAGSVPAAPDERQAVLDEAAAAGAAETSVTDAVVEAVRALESSPRFNAGVGSAVGSDGIPRTDAGLMTDDREVGAACAMPGVEHAVEVARVVSETPHVLVAGVHAVDLADAYGVGVERDLWTEETRRRWADLDPPAGGPESDPREHLAWVREQFGDGGGGGDGGDGSEKEGGASVRSHDTVGAVASDGGNLAAATSTGGRWCVLAGRVGDVPQVGGGFYCSPAGGASATGHGEDIARVTLSRRAVDLLADHAPDAAAERAVGELDDLTGGTAGVVLLDADGRAGSAFNSDLMQTSVVED